MAGQRLDKPNKALFRGIFMAKRLIVFSAAIAVALFILPFSAGTKQQQAKGSEEKGLPIAEAAMLQNDPAPAVTSGVSYETRVVWVTAYASTPEETDSTPFITASMTDVHDGVIAVNFLPFGTKVMIPKLFGDKIFTVEDRMHWRKKDFVDIWMPTKQDAINFGIDRTEIVILHED